MKNKKEGKYYYRFYFNFLRFVVGVEVRYIKLYSFLRFVFKRLYISFNIGCFFVIIEILEKLENLVYWILNDFIKVLLIRVKRYKVLVFGLIKWVIFKV